MNDKLIIIVWVINGHSSSRCNPELQGEKKSENVSHSVMSNFLKLHGILQARPRVAIPFFRASSQPRDQTRVSFIAGKFFTI